MSNIFLVAQREYLERVRRRSFWIMTILLPVFLAAIMGLSMNNVMHGEQVNQEHPAGSPYAEQIDTLRNELHVLEAQEDAWAGNDHNMPMIVGLFVGMLVMIMITMFGGMVLSAVLEEKQSRLVEVLLTSIKPFDLMMGKILGISMVALTQLLMWGVVTAVLTGGLVSYFHVPVAAGSVTPDLVQMADGFGLEGFHWAPMFWSALFFLITGFLLMTGFSAMAGAAVDNETDGKQIQGFLTLACLIPMYFETYIADDPNGLLARCFSFFPLTAISVMPMRIGIGVATWEVVLSMAIMALSVMGVVWAAGRVYRIGIMLYGKKASFSEVLRWIIKG